MTFWIVRAEKHGSNEKSAIEKNLITIGWNELPGRLKTKPNGLSFLSECGTKKILLMKL